MASEHGGKVNVGVVGATGVVGETFLLLLDERAFPFNELRLFASDASRGLKRKVDGREFSVTTLSEGCFDGLDIVFFSSGDDVSKEWAPKAVKSGAIAIDNSGAFRMESDVLLNVPEVNGDLLPKLKLGERASAVAQVIANPNCSTIQLVVALKPLADRYGLEFVRVSSYQSVSGAGKAGIEELLQQTKLAVEGETPSKGATFPKPIAFDCIPQIGSFVIDGSADDGFCSEEIKIMNETRKIMRLPSLRVSAFTVRVPTLNSHAETVWVTLKKPAASLNEIEGVLAAGDGIELFGRTMQNHAANHARSAGVASTRGNLTSALASAAAATSTSVSSRSSQSGPLDYPTQALASGEDPVYVGRVHRDPNEPNTWMMWVVSDNLRKGAALNGIQIAEKIYGLR